MPRGAPFGSTAPSATTAAGAIDNSLNAFAQIACPSPQERAASSSQGARGPPAVPVGGPMPNRYALWSAPPSAPGAVSDGGPAVAIKEWVASHNLEISRTHPDREGSPWDYIGHRFPREKSPGTAVHSKVLTEGKWAAEFKVLESKGLSGAFGPSRKSGPPVLRPRRPCVPGRMRARVT